MTRQRIFQVLSCFGYGIFCVPVFGIVWFCVPILREFPIGDDSPTSGATLGFLVGCLAGSRLVAKWKSHWKTALYIAAGLAVLAVLSALWLVSENSIKLGAWGLGEILAWLLWLNLPVAALGLLSAGVFGWRAGRHPKSAPVPPVETPCQ